MADLISEVDDSTFNAKVIEQSKKIPVVVQFYATWCMPCRMLAPLLESAIKGRKGKFLLVRVDIDLSPIVSRQYNIFSVPDVRIFKNGKITDSFTGFVPEEFLENWLKINA